MRSRSERQTCLQEAGALRPSEDEAQNALRPMRQADEANNPNRRLVPNGRSDQLRPSGGCPATEAINSQPPDGCPTGEGLITPTAGLDRGRRTSVNSVVSARAACEGLITPLRQHSLVGDRGRANHPPVVPVQQGSRTQGFYGRKPWKKPNSTLIIDVPRPAEEGLRRPFRRLPPNRSQNFTGNPSHSRPGYRHRSPKLSLFRSSRFLIALRVSKSAV